MLTARPDSTASANPAEKTGDADKTVLSWKVSLVGMDAWYRPLIAVLIVVGVLAMGTYLYGDVILISVSAGILFLATADYFFPMRFQITREAAYRRTIFGTRFIRWTNVKHCYLDEKGIKLSPLEKPSRAEVFRGMFLYFGDSGKKRDELVETVRRLAARKSG